MRYVDFLLVGMVRRVLSLQVAGVGRCGGWNYLEVCKEEKAELDLTKT